MRLDKKVFAEWKIPNAMRTSVEELRLFYGFELMYRPQMRFWHEAFIAAKFGKLLEIPYVRLVCDADRPDFETARGFELKQFEITEADRNNRRRGSEYKELQRKLEQGVDIESAEWATWLTPDIVAADLERVSKLKAQKRYNSDVGLVISLLGLEFDSMEKDNDAVMHRATELAGLRFDSVWVLMSSRLRRLWYKRTHSDCVYRPS